MNKHISLKRAAFTAAALGVLSATAAFAQTTPAISATDSTTTSTGTGGQPGGGWHHHHHHFGAGVLSKTERAELKKDKDQVLASNPALKTQEETLHQQFKTLRSANPPATQAQFAALKQQHEALRTQMRTAIESTDAGAAALFAKIDAAKGQHHHHAS